MKKRIKMSSWKGKAVVAEVPTNGGYLTIHFETERTMWMGGFSRGFSKHVDLQLNPSNADLAAVCEEQNYVGPIIRFDQASPSDALKTMHEVSDSYISGSLDVDSYIRTCKSHNVPVQCADKLWKVRSL